MKTTRIIRDLIGALELRRGIRRLAEDILDTEDAPQDEDAPLLKFGPGGDFTEEVGGRDGRLLVPPGGAASSRDEPRPPFSRSEP